jgi:hypothetical protein
MKPVTGLFLLVVWTLPEVGTLYAQTYPIVDTGQNQCFNNREVITPPQPGEAFYGQDAQHQGPSPSYTDNGDGTVTDNVTGLMWQQSPDRNGDGRITIDDKLTAGEAVEGADTFDLAGYDDWRLPSIKELYSLILFSGRDVSAEATNADDLSPFLDDEVFEFGYGDIDAGERIIDAQFATSTFYASTTMGGDKTMFGVNFADGRIKGYPAEPLPNGEEKGFYVLYVRGNQFYGINDFFDNGDGTVTDRATGLMWQQSDSETGLDWQEALARVEEKNAQGFLGYHDWRLPNAKELQSIVDYTRAPAVTGSAAIDPVFTCSVITDEGGAVNYPFYWSSTTHANQRNGEAAAYVAFGEGLGWMSDPLGTVRLMDVHGAGCQRSDPKTGDASDYPYGRGPQGDVVRIDNLVRLVRDVETTTHIDSDIQEAVTPGGYVLENNVPNPFNPETTIRFHVPDATSVFLKVYNSRGQQVDTLVDGLLTKGWHEVSWSAVSFPSGLYFYTLILGGGVVESRKMMLVK